jgi:hypothetical protein
VNNSESCQIKSSELDTGGASLACVQALVAAGMLPIAALGPALKAGKAIKTVKLSAKKIEQIQNYVDETMEFGSMADRASYSKLVASISKSTGGARLLTGSEKRTNMILSHFKNNPQKLKDIVKGIERDPEGLAALLKELDSVCK